MLNYNKDTNMISMIAKDTGDFIVSLDNYLLADGDIVYFTVNTGLEKENPLISKEVTTFTNNKAIIRLTTEDTNLAIGTYLYDV
jgi:hypothetical protein